MRLNIPQRRRWHLAGMLLLLAALLTPSLAAEDSGLKVASLLLQDKAVASLPDVLLRPPGQKAVQRQTLATGQALPPGTEVTLPRGATAVLVSRNDNRITLFPGAVFIVGTVTDRGESHQPVSGRSAFDVRRALDFFNVSYARFTAAVKGTVYSVDISPSSQTIGFEVREGTVEVEQRVPVRVRGSNTPPATGDVQVVDEISAGQQRRYDLSVERYLKEFGNFGDAEAFFKQGLAEAERSGQPQRLHRAIANLMSVYSTLRRPQDTLDLVARCEAAAQASRLPQAPLACDTSAGNALALLGRHREALERHQRVLDSERARLGPRDSTWLAIALSNLATSNRGLGQVDRGLAQYREALQMRKRLVGGADNHEIVRLQSNLANALLLRGDLDEAGELFDEAYTMLQRLQKGVPHPTEATLLGGTARTRMEAGDYADAIGRYRQALAVLDKLFPGAEHLDKAFYTAAIGGAQTRLGQQAQARQNLEAALAMRRRLLGPIDHPDIASNLSSLAGVLRAQGDMQGAMALQEQASAMRRRLVGNVDHPSVAADMTSVALAKAESGGDLDEALALTAQSTAMYRRLYGNVDHPEIARNLSNQGHYLMRQNRLAEAIASFTQSLEMRRRLFNDAPHPSMASTLDTLARLQTLSGHPDRAIALSSQALRMREALYQGRPHRDIVASLRSLADLTDKAGRSSDAAAYRSRADTMQRQLAQK